jgi:hypothetical protein
MTPEDFVHHVGAAVDGVEVDGSQRDVADALLTAGRVLTAKGLEHLNVVDREIQLMGLEAKTRTLLFDWAEAAQRRAASPYPRPNGKMNGHGHG